MCVYSVCVRMCVYACVCVVCVYVYMCVHAHTHVPEWVWPLNFQISDLGKFLIQFESFHTIRSYPRLMHY